MPTILKHLDDYVAYKRLYGWRGRSVGDGRLADVVRILNRFARELPRLVYARMKRADVRIERITTDAIRRWQQKRLKDVAACTVNKDLNILRGYVRWLIREGYWKDTDAELVQWMHVDDLPYFRKPPEALSINGLKSFLGSLRAHIRLPLLAVFVFGDRPGAVYALNNRDIIITASGDGMVRLRSRKGGRERSIAFTCGDDVDRLMCAAREQFIKVIKRPPRGADPVFVNLRGNRWRNDSMNKSIKHWLKKDKKRQGGLHPYVLRRSLATLAAVANVCSSPVQLVLGQSRRDTAEKYTHLAGSDATAARQRTYNAFGGLVRGLLKRV